MALPVYRLRRILAATAAVIVMVVASMYIYARWRTKDVLSTIPGKIGIDIKQTANGFQISKSDGKRTLFTIQASEVKEFKLNGRAELHNVSIVLYGRDSSRYDRIYGDDFSYDPKTGNVVAKGDVQIDLVANPTGLTSPDQSTPKELKNPIHLKTRDLVFNRETGNAFTGAQVEFQTPQASGSALGVKYTGASNVLTLDSKIHLELTGENAAAIDAERGTVTNEPRLISLENVRLERENDTFRANWAEFHLGLDNQVERIVAWGNVAAETRPVENGKSADAAESRVNAERAEFTFSEKRNLLRNAVLTGNVRLDQDGPAPIQGSAGRVVLDFGGRSQLEKVRALDGVRLVQTGVGAKKAPAGSEPQRFELTSPEIDFAVGPGNSVQRAFTQGAAQIAITSLPEEGSASPGTGQRTVVTANSFEGKFNASGRKNRLSAVYGTGNSRVVNSNAGIPDRVSTSDNVGVILQPQGGVDVVNQGGNVAYTDNQSPEKRVQAWADLATYTPSDQRLILRGKNLSGPVRVSVGSMVTTCHIVRINRATGEAVAEDDVKTTYNEMKEQPDGALLASASPIHVSARSMTANNTGVALYTGNVRLWQDGNVIQAPSMRFDRDKRFVGAEGTATQPVQTVLVQKEQPGAKASDGAGKTGASTSPVSITAARFTYSDSDRKAHYEGGVVAKGSGFTASANTLDAYLLPRSQTSGPQSRETPGQLDRIVAQGNVKIQQPKRRAEGDKLVYTAAEDKFVLSGGPPSIFDAEQGKITGVSLTFFRRDDRVLVEGEAKAPVVTTTRVAR